ncbi:hypothetical protein A966_06630 [Brachyspira hampsonii 30446]|uniref:Thioredoxin-like fold domain-containing protein n=1 Tax=Brachyspira hampsonii 30446 TaxID=1289135 RepID=A0A2U4EZJ7_9SPIR|nr:hypothetical protein A966_06630 [Brachyspira hampsonii 30446]MBW5389224.1 thioredoxin family protein [Brachyspira hampsonii]MBW5393824.1 thioredoxin family protein [Brachyspira hampsonii]OEJ16925.1 hypothetical protein A9495_00750 [Brachyspira hampsonii]PTY39652.1 hypothetical protein DQ06_03290 [Brachyspira hampsonii bv. II]
MPDPLEEEGIEREIEKILLLGNDDKNSLDMLGNLRKAILELDLDLSIKYTDSKGSMSYYGVMTLPALIVNDELISYGEVLDKDRIVSILKEKL